MALADIDFADIAIEKDPSASRYKRFSSDLRLSEIPLDCHEELINLREKMMTIMEPRFRLTWNGMQIRVQRRDTAYGPVFVARRIATVLRKLNETGLPTQIIQRLMDQDLRAGLLLLAGGPGAGKTTVACAMLIARLELIGGFTWTAENPVEFHLQGPHGPGQCYQEDIGEDAEVKRVLMDTVRSGADTFYIGEIREEQGAKAASLAAASGLLVVSTIHADNPQQAIMKMGMLAGFDSLAQSLKGILTLRMDRQISAANGARNVLNVQSYFVDNEPARLKIREGNMTAIAQEMDTQKNRALSGFSGLASRDGSPSGRFNR